MNALSAHIVLASASPRRLEILQAHDIEPDVIVPRIDEDALIASWPGSLEPEDLARNLALCKAQAVYQQLKREPLFNPQTFIIGADTLVYKDGIGVLGKPADNTEALGMLEALCNTSHLVISGVALIDVATGDELSFTDITTVSFDAYDRAEIEHYLALEPPLDKAGSYAIQGYWGRHVVSLEGDLENVIGLPYYRLEALLFKGN